MPLSGEMPKIALCHAEPVRHSAANGPERSEGAQGKLREASLFCWRKNGQRILRFPQNDNQRAPSSDFWIQRTRSGAEVATLQNI